MAYNAPARYGLAMPDPREMYAASYKPSEPSKRKFSFKKYLIIALPFMLIANVLALGDYGCMQTGKRLGFSHMMIVPIVIEGRVSIIPVPMYQCVVR